MADTREIYLAGGCFWCVEDYYLTARGIVETECGYCNGHTPNPTYEAVYTDATGYAETVRVVYDADIASLPEILDGFFKMIDPTSENSQRGDTGTRYRSAVFYTDERDEGTLNAALSALKSRCDAPVYLELAPLEVFVRAEEYHQQYYRKQRERL